AQKASAGAELRLQEEQFKRYERLEHEGATSRELLDQFRTRLLTSQAEVRRLNAEIEAQRAAVTQAEKTLQQSQAAVREQQVNLRDLRITAPFAGQVGDIPIKVGDYVTPETEVVTLADNQVLWVNVPIPAERASELRLQMPVQILTPEGQSLGQGRVFFIAPTVNRQDQSVLVKAAYDNTAGRLRADQQVKTQIIWREQSGVAVPTTAVVTLAGQSFVYVAEPNPEQPGQRVARQRPVRLGPIQANRYPVLEGLRAGDQVITTNLLKLSDGAPVVPETRASQTQP
ncbi:MAG: efflux RND transporter periplasmic adaptor subunit, partial [Gloeomargaritaceae cyanobacterium C42_A2020_066]|nr:efflux RND transporter periplasmic adaptor subunit [Gloeomargaritaceae cyanobacterium C42_A2020_066]